MRTTIWALLIPFIFSGSALAGTSPVGLTYQGRIMKPNGTPLESASVQFTLQIRSPGAESCVLFEEAHTLDMTASDGVFSLVVGAGTPTGGSTPYSVTQVFSNAGAFTGLTCASGTTYTASAAAVRKLKVSFDDGAGLVTISPDHDIQSVPYALHASRLEGLGKDAFIKVNTASSDLTQAKADQIFLPANFTELMNLITGASTQYAKSGDLPVAGGVLNLAGGGVLVPDVPASGDAAVNKDYVDVYLGGKTLDATGVGPAVGNGKILVWDQGANKWVVGDAVDATKLPLAGGTMTGPLVNNSNSASTAVAVTQSGAGSAATFMGGNVGIGTTVPASLLDASSATGGVMTLSRNDTAASSGDSVGKLQFWNNDTQLTGQKIYGDIEIQAAQTVTTNAAAGNMIFRTTGATAGGSPVERMRIDASGYVGIGNSPSAPAYVLDVWSNWDTAGAVRIHRDHSGAGVVAPVLTLVGSNSGGGGATGQGVGINFIAETDSNSNDTGSLEMIWTTATDASRTSAMIFKTVNNASAVTERMRIAGNGNVGIGTISPNASALLDIESLTKGVLIPRMTTAQRDAIATPATGLQVYNTTTNALNFYNGSAWQALGVAGSGLTSLGGQTGSMQTFASGSAGTAPAISSAADVHTLNIPLASGAGVTSGTISKTDYDAFVAKLTSPLTTKGDLLSRDGSTHVRLPAGTNGQVLSADSAETSGLKWVTPASGTVTNVTGTAPIVVATGTTTPVISIADATTSAKGAVQVGSGLAVAAGVVSADIGTTAGKVMGADAVLNCLATQKLQMSAGPTFAWSCVTDDTSDATKLPLAGGTMTGPLVNNSNSASTAVAVTQSGAGYAATFMGGNVGIGTTSPGYLLHVNKGVAGNSVYLDGGAASSSLAIGGGSYAPATTSSSIRSSPGGLVISSLANNAIYFNRDATGSDVVFQNGSSTDLMTIKSSGNVGIGTTSPSGTNRLEVVSAAGQTVNFANKTSSGWNEMNVSAGATDQVQAMMQANYTTSTVNIGSRSNHTLAFKTADTSRLTIDTTGNVGIGTITPSTALHVVGQVRSTNSAGSEFLADGSSGSKRSVAFTTGGTVRWQLGAHDAAESGSNTGSSFYIERFNDAGTSIDVPFYITRSSGNVGIGTINPNASALLDIESLTKGILIPRMTTTQRDAIVTPATGLQVYNTTTNALNFYNGSAWQALGVAGSGLTSLGGQTGSTQTFASGSAGTAPAISSASDVHTLNIPLASGAGVTSGTIAKTDYDAFVAKLTSPLTTKGDLLSRDGSTHVRLPAGTNGQVLTADSAETSGLKWAAPSVSASQITQSSANTDDVLTWSGTAWVADTIAGVLGFTPVNKAGDTMTGTLTVPTLAVTGDATAGAVRASKQVTSQSFSGASDAVNWDNGNVQTTSSTCQALAFTNMLDGGTYTLIVTDTATAGCVFPATVNGGTAVTWRGQPTLASHARTASSHTVYTMLRVGSQVYVSWITGF